MSTETTNAAERFVKVGDLNLHYLEWGNAGAPPVIMVHGLTGNSHAFDNLAPHFLPRYHVISVDVRGGATATGPPMGTIPMMPTWPTWRACARPSGSSASRWWEPQWGAASP